MTGIYWYVSRQKVDALLPEFGPRGFSLFKELSLTLKAPFAEAKTSVNTDRSLFLHVGNIENGLKSAGVTTDVSDAGSKPFFSFRGRAHRAVDSGAYFIVLAQNSTALLLAGSPTNAVGAPPKQSDDISPSADPLGAVRRSFGELSDREGSQLGEMCSYIWDVLAGPVSQSWDALPEVEGIAVYGARFPPAKGQFSGAKFSDIDRIVIGTPIFVRQT